MSHFGTIGNTVTVQGATGTLDNQGNFIWDKCPGCGGPVFVTLEQWTGGERKVCKCMDPKTSGCLS